MTLYTTAKGNILSSQAKAVVNTVNTQGVMGAGLALQFKTTYPSYFKDYQQRCSTKEVRIGHCTSYKLPSGQLIISFPSKDHWRNGSEYAYIESGLISLKELILEQKLSSIAIPPLGCGLGGLHWPSVRQIIEQHLNNLPTTVYIHAPAGF